MTPERRGDATMNSDTRPYCPLFRGRPMTPMAAPWGKADRPPCRAQWRPYFWNPDAPPPPGRRCRRKTGTRASERPARLSRHQRPPAICHARPGRRMPTLAPPSIHPGGRRLTHLYCPGTRGPHRLVPPAAVPPRPPQAGRRRGQSGDGGVSSGVRPRRGRAVVPGPRLSFRSGPVPPGRLRLADPVFPHARMTRTPRCCKRVRPVSAAMVFDNRGDALFSGRPNRSRR